MTPYTRDFTPMEIEALAEAAAAESHLRLNHMEYSRAQRKLDRTYAAAIRARAEREREREDAARVA